MYTTIEGPVQSFYWTHRGEKIYDTHVAIGLQ